MELRRLRYALAVAEHLGFERAAKALGVSQSAVSRGVDALECELGVTLFERHGGGVRLTVPGRAILDRLQRPYRDLQSWSDFARATGVSETGSLGVGFYPDLASGILRQILTEHHRRWPEVTTRFLEGAPTAQLSSLRARGIDVAFLMATEPARGVESEEVWAEPMLLAVPIDHRLANSAGVSWAELKSERFLVRGYETGPVVYAWLAACLGISGYSPNIEQHEVSRGALLGLAACGYGLLPVPGSATGFGYPGLKFVPIVGERSTAPVRIAWLAENFNPALQRFLAHTREVAERERRISLDRAEARVGGGPAETLDPSP